MQLTRTAEWFGEILWCALYRCWIRVTSARRMGHTNPDHVKHGEERMARGEMKSNRAGNIHDSPVELFGSDMSFAL